MIWKDFFSQTMKENNLRTYVSSNHLLLDFMDFSKQSWWVEIHMLLMTFDLTLPKIVQLLCRMVS